MSIRKTATPLGLDYVRKFTDAYRGGSDICLREILCEDVQFPTILVPPRETDLLAGKRIFPEVGYSLQFGGLGYYYDAHVFAAKIADEGLGENEREEWKRLRDFWAFENTVAKCLREFEAEVRERLPEPYQGGENLVLPAYPLYRMAGLQPDYEKLVLLGLQGLEETVSSHRDRAATKEAKDFYGCCLASVARINRCLRHYRGEVGNSPANLRLGGALDGLLEHPPRTFHEALQLVLLVSTVLGTVNFGRLDVALGPFLCRDLDGGTLAWSEALDLMRNFFIIIEEEILHFDARVTVGGMGRKNEAQADRFAMLAMETTDSLNLPLPQLTLRFHAAQDPRLLEKGYDVIANGKTFPMLYNDDVNVPAVENAFAIDRETAEQYLPFGCGEYMIEHRSCGTPNAIINLQRCVESAIHHGRCLRTGKIIGPDYGGLETQSSFEDVWSAYTRTVDYFLDALIKGQDSIYKTVGKTCPYSLVSMLYDDCLAKGRPIFSGGIRLLGGTNETYGNTNAADSLGAIQELVFHRPACTGQELVDALRDDWKGHELMRKKFKAAPKYGNDDDVADSMSARVHDHICAATRDAAARTSLHHFLVVVINNNHNTLWGLYTSASADGRHHCEPLAPGNAPGAGCDRNGLTAVLNSQAKLDPKFHAGSVQNVKLSSSFPRQHRPLYHKLFDTYFKKGGTQAMITVTNRTDLLAALEHPEKYANLLVRVGGFSARFIDLDPATQQEILSRTEHSA